MPDPDRQDRLAAAVRKTLIPFTQTMTTRWKIGEGLPPQAVTPMWQEFGDTFCDWIKKDPVIAELLTEGDVRTAGGKLNGPAIVAAVEEAAKARPDEGGRQQLNTLAQHLRHTLTNLRLMKGEKDGV